MLRNRSNRGFTLIELMIVVSIIGILASIAVPTYKGYIKQSKISALIEHITNAYKLAKSESAKIAAGSAGQDIVVQLNLGNRLAVSDPTQPAFVIGPPGIALPGQVSIDGLDGLGRPVAGNPVTISANPVNGTAAADYIEPLSITFIPE